MTQVFVWMLASGLIYGQTPDSSLRFEVASVKASAPTPKTPGVRFGCNGGPGTDSPGQITCSHAALSLMLRKAFALQAYQYRSPDGPIDFSAPVMTGGFDMAAKIPQGATAVQVRTMWQNLLVERFKLAYHFETKESPVFDLTAAKGGLKLKDAPPAGDEAAPPPKGRTVMDSEGCPVQHPRRGTSSVAFQSGAACYAFSAFSMEDLVTFITARVGVPVVDLTGLKGTYDFSLRFAQGDNDVATAPVLPKALQQQLGLKLEDRKGTAQIFVVDHVEKIPTGN